MGKRGKRGRGGGHHGGREANNNVWGERTNKSDVKRYNDQYESYYDQLEILPEEEKGAFWKALRTDLPNSFRFTGSKLHALAVQERLKDFYIPQITSIEWDGEVVEPPKPVPWYPDKLAWYMTTPKHVVRRFRPFASFQKFLVAETDVGNISRQEIVSMIPPLCMDLDPAMTVLDLCAAPGSKSAQLIEMIHAREEERTRKVADQRKRDQDGPDGDNYWDNGRAPGLLIANDVDYRRAHMLVHQMKRLGSPNLIVTNHDATLYPSIKLPSFPSANGRPSPKKYLKFDRILADVPCSGDGTCRKNLEIWRKWNPAVALGLHPAQVRILVRALQMLKVGGRVVYSTCSMNPVENEAVLAAAIDRCGGTEIVEIMDSSKYLPELQRKPGIRSWKVMDKQGRVWTSWGERLAQLGEGGVDSLGKLQESLFPPKDNLHLERCMRVYPHLQNTGAFFVAVLEKKSEIKARTEPQPKLIAGSVTNASLRADLGSDEVQGMNDTAGTVDPFMLQAQRGAYVSPKRESAEGSAQDQWPKRQKILGTREVEGTVPAGVNSVPMDAAERSLVATSIDMEKTDVEPTRDRAALPQAGDTRSGARSSHDPSSNGSYKIKTGGHSFEEPFKYLDPGLQELEQIKQFYDIDSAFPMDRFMVRNADGVPHKNIYYTTALAKSILEENEGKGMKFVHSGVKMFVKQEVPHPEICRWRIQTDGLAIVEPWVGSKRRVRLWKRETLRRLLVEMFPRFNGDEWQKLGEIGEQVREIGMGCCILEVELSEAEDGLRERMVFPLWKSLHSLNLMLPKEDRKALLLRLYNDHTPLVNSSSQNKQKEKASEAAIDLPLEQDTPVAEVHRNSSSECDE